MKTAYVTHIGAKKNNQDSLMILCAQTSLGEAVFAMVCDGMGGIQKGELASAQVIHMFAGWFENGFPKMLRDGFDPDRLFHAWENIIQNSNQILIQEGKRHGIQIGTTIAGVLLLQGHYYIVNVGDSRVYQITEGGVRCLTKDHSLVMREVEEGRLAPDQLEHDSRRNILLQCVGATGSVNPDYLVGSAKAGILFMICCDGYRHEVTPREFYEELRPDIQTGSSSLQKHLDFLLQKNIERGEQDNMTAVALLAE